MKLVAFAGIARSGKTTAADYLMSKFNKSSKKLSFADPMKSSASCIGITKESHPNVYREYCQFTGEKLRSFDPDWWVKLYSQKLDCNTSYDLVVTDDVRYPNEIEFLKSKGAILVYVDARTRIKPDPNIYPYNHESEKMALNYYGDPIIMKNFHYVLNNNQSSEEEYKKQLELLHYEISTEMSKTS